MPLVTFQQSMASSGQVWKLWGQYFQHRQLSVRAQPKATAYRPSAPVTAKPPARSILPGPQQFTPAAVVQHRRLWQHAAPTQEAAAAEQPPTSTSQDDLVEIGIFGTPHGVRGEIRVQPLTDFPEERLGQPGLRYIQAPATGFGRRKPPAPTAVDLEFGRPVLQKGQPIWLVKVKGVDSPEAALALKGHTLLSSQAERTELEDEDEFYIQELVGAQVVMHDSKELVGTVLEIFTGTGTHDVLKVKRLQTEAEFAEEGLRTSLIPFVKDIVPVVHREHSVLEITPPKGLLDLYTTARSRGSRERAAKQKKKALAQQRREPGVAKAGQPEGQSAQKPGRQPRRWNDDAL